MPHLPRPRSTKTSSCSGIVATRCWTGRSEGGRTPTNPPAAAEPSTTPSRCPYGRAIALAAEQAAVEPLVELAEIGGGHRVVLDRGALAPQSVPVVGPLGRVGIFAFRPGIAPRRSRPAPDWARPWLPEFGRPRGAVQEPQPLDDLLHAGFVGERAHIRPIYTNSRRQYATKSRVRCT